MATIRDQTQERAAFPNSPIPPPFRHERPRWQRRLINAAYPTVTLVLAIVAWGLYVEIANIQSFLLPGPIPVFQEMVIEWDFLWEQTQTTMLETGIGFFIAVGGGILVAIWIATFPLIERSVYPLLVASQVIPKVALAPMLLIKFGFGITSKVVVVILIAFFPVVVNGVIGLQSLEQEKIYLAQSMGASRWSTFWRIRFPHSLPTLFGGVKLAAIFSVVGAVVGEFIGADAGLGRTLLLAMNRLNAELLYATVGYLTIMGISFYVLVDIIERIAIPWHISKRRGTTGV